MSSKIKRGRKTKVVEFNPKKTDKPQEFNVNVVNILHLPIQLEKLLNLNINFKKHSTVEPLKEIDNYDPLKIYNERKKKITIIENNGLPTSEGKIVAKKIEDVICWWCCHGFDTYPIFCPEYYSDIEDSFRVKGIFCSFNCVKAYMIDMNSKRIYLASSMFRRIKGYYTKITPAPNRSLLKRFGGHLSIEEYREKFNSITEYYTNIYPMAYSRNQIEIHEEIKIYNDSVEISNTRKNAENVLSEKTISNAKTRIKTKKNDTDKKDNSLLTLMNIKIVN